MKVGVRPVAPADADVWLAMRRALWPEDGQDRHSGHKTEIARFFAGELELLLGVLLAETRDGRVVGFVELNIRPYAEGCATNRVGFLEGWYVVPDARRHGVGRALIQASEEWAKAQGCSEFASNALADNAVSTAAHRALGFEEVEVIRCFRKDLR